MKIINCYLNTCSYIVEVDHDTYLNYTANYEEIWKSLPKDIDTIASSNDPAKINCLIIASYSKLLDANDIAIAIDFVASFNQN